MSLSLDDYSAAYMIRAYEPGRILVNQTWCTETILLFPDCLISENLPKTISELNQKHLKEMDSVSVLLIGTGAELIFPPIEVYAELLTKGIGVEIMDTRAACRTFQVLCSEGRSVAALLCV